MTETFHYPPAAPAQRPPREGAPGPVLLSVAGPAAQRRATVAVRLILAVPHLFALYILGLAASVVAVIGWFGALVTGRLPDFAQTYLAGYLRWRARVGAYLLLLTDEYPPFTLDDTAYPVRLVVGSGRLNRLTVLFRFILAIPAAIVSLLLTSGFTTIVIFIGWLTALVAGRLPTSFHQASAAVLRYSVRCYGYQFLLTGDYPGQLFGDRAGQQAEPAASPPAAGGYPGQAGPHPGYSAPWPPAGDYSPPGYGAPGFGAPSYGAPSYGAPNYGPAGYAAPGYWTPPVPPAAASPAAGGWDRGWQLILSPGARRLVGVLLVLGLLTAAAEGASIGIGVNAARERAAQINQLTADVTRFSSTVAQHNAAAARQQRASLQLGNSTDALVSAHNALLVTVGKADFNSCSTPACFNTTSAPVADAFTTFSRALRAIPVPPGSAAAKKRLSADTATCGQDWRASVQDATFDSLETDANAAEKDGARVDSDYTTLWSSLTEQGAAMDSKTSSLNSEAHTLNDEGSVLRQRAVALNVTVTVPTAQTAA